MAAATAFYAMLSTIPIIFVLISGVGFFLEDSHQATQTVAVAADAIIPSFSNIIKKEVSALVKNRSVIGGTGLLIMLWSSALVFSSMEFAFSRIFNIEKRRSFLKSKLVNIGLVALAVIVLTASTLLATMAKIAESAISLPYSREISSFFSSSTFLQYILPLIILTALFTALYIILSRRSVTFFEGLSGGTACAMMFEGGKYVFTWYISNLGKHSLIYGSLGAIVISILWFFYASVIILFCAEILARHKGIDGKAD